MDMMYYEGKRIYVKLNSDRVYSGLILEVTYLGKDNSNVHLYMFTLQDKYNKMVCFNSKEIKFIEEEK